MGLWANHFPGLRSLPLRASESSLLPRWSLGLNGGLSHFHDNSICLEGKKKHRNHQIYKKCLFQKDNLWRFPFRHRGTPSHHPVYRWIFHETSQPFLDTPMTMEPPYIPRNPYRQIVETILFLSGNAKTITTFSKNTCRKSSFNREPFRVDAPRQHIF